MNIFIGSILKPLDDVRHYQKLAQSLASNLALDIHIGGRNVPHPIQSPSTNIHFHRITPRHPHYGSRFLALFHAFGLLLRLKPALYMACTHELLVVMALYKLVYGGTFVYDVQENYSKNILVNKTYPTLVKQILASWISFKERLVAPVINHFVLAEACYATELPFVRNNFRILENKSCLFQEAKNVRLKDKASIRLLYSGTIAEENGVFEAIDLAIALHRLDSRYELSIVGCCHSKKVYAQLEKLKQQYPSIIHLTIALEPISYALIQKELLSADVGLVCYQPQINFENKMPTKLYEYTSVGLPILLAQNEKWKLYCQTFQNYALADFSNIDPEQLHTSLQESVFYPHGNSEKELFQWGSLEEKALSNLVHCDTNNSITMD